MANGFVLYDPFSYFITCFYFPCKKMWEIYDYFVSKLMPKGKQKKMVDVLFAVANIIIKIVVEMLPGGIHMIITIH